MRDNEIVLVDEKIQLHWESPGTECRSEYGTLDHYVPTQALQSIGIIPSQSIYNAMELVHICHAS